jgi:UDP-glucose 4-epimerase
MGTNWRGCKVAIIGASGFIGSHLVERLVREGADVLAIGRHPGHLRAVSAITPGYRFCAADIMDEEHLVTLLRTSCPEVVFHLAAYPDGAEIFPEMHERVRINMLGGMNTLEAAIVCGSRVFVLADSTKSYGNHEIPYTATQVVDPLCSYAIAKTALWQLCQLAAKVHKLAVVGLRLTFVYGPRQGWNLISYVHKCIREGTPIALQGGSQTRDPLYIDDAVDALLAAATHAGAFGHSIPVGGGEEISIRDLCQTMLDILGQNLPIIENADTLRLTEIWRSSVDNADARRLLNWTPQTLLTDGLVKTLRPVVTPEASSTGERREGSQTYVDTSEL